MNKVILMGRLTRDPEMRQTPSGVAMARFTIAVDRRFASKDGQRTADFIGCVAWRQTAEFICRYFHKGSMIGVVGNIQTRAWDGADGKRQYATDVVVDEAYFTGSRAETGGGSQGYSAGAYSQGGFQQPYPQDNYRQSEPQFDMGSDGGMKTDFDDFMEAGFSAADSSEDDLPF